MLSAPFQAVLPAPRVPATNPPTCISQPTPPRPAGRSAKTPLASAVCGLVLAGTLLFLTPLFTHLSKNVQVRGVGAGSKVARASTREPPLPGCSPCAPSTPTLATPARCLQGAIVLVGVLSLIDLQETAFLWRVRGSGFACPFACLPSGARAPDRRRHTHPYTTLIPACQVSKPDFAVYLLAANATCWLGIVRGVVLAVAISVALAFHDAAFPRIGERAGRLRGGGPGRMSKRGEESRRACRAPWPQPAVTYPALLPLLQSS